MSAAERADFRQRHRLIPRREPDNRRRRSRLEKTPARWLRYYLPGAYRRPFGTPHLQMIDAALYAVESGGWHAVAAPRGTGKTTVENGIALFCLATGRVRYPAVVPWKQPDAKKALRFWHVALSSDGPFLDDYPELCDPFRKSNGSSQKLKTLLWEDTGEPTGAQVRMSEGIIILPDGLGVIGSGSLNGNVRGLQFTTDTGEVLRPDFLLIDDPSDKATARSREQSRLNVEKIDEDLLNMAGPSHKIAACMTCTPMTRHDTASHYLGDDTPDWHGMVIPQVSQWPDDMAAWDEWNVTRLDGLGNRDKGRAARAFYRKHRARLRQGVAVSWSQRYDRNRKQPDAIYSAMEDFYRLGRKGFFQERQCVTEDEAGALYTITPEIIMGRTNGLERKAQQHDGAWHTAGIDVNYAGLHWATASCTNDLAAAITNYGVFPGRGVPVWAEGDPRSPEQSVYEAVVRLVRDTLCAEGHTLTRIVVDGNFQTETVYRAAEYLNGKVSANVIAGRGMPSQKYYPPSKKHAAGVRKVGDGCKELKGLRGWSLYFNSHHWHERFQRGFLLEPLSPGSVSLFGKDGAVHRMFGEHAAKDQLLRKYMGGRGLEVMEWADVRDGNDLGDAAVMAIVAAAIEGADPNADHKKAESKKAQGIHRINRTRW